MKWLVRVAMVTVLLVTIGRSGIGLATQVNAATAKTYQTKGVVEWVYGPEQNGPGAEKPIKGNDANGSSEAPNHNSVNDISNPSHATGNSVNPKRTDVARKLVTDTSGVIPTNGIASANGQRNSQLPQTGAAADALQRIVQMFGVALLMIALVSMLMRKRNSRNVNFVS